MNSAGFSTTVQPAASAGRDLPGEHQQRKVPRDDLADDADRLVIRKLPVERLRPAGMVDEMADRQRHVDVAAFADRLAVVERFQHREQALVPLHGAADGVEDLGALVARARAPFRQRLGCRGNRGIDIGVAGVGDLRERLAGRGIAGVEALAGPGGDPLAADEQRFRKIRGGEPGVGLVAGFRRRAVVHRGIAFENVHGEPPSPAP